MKIILTLLFTLTLSADAFAQLVPDKTFPTSRPSRFSLGNYPNPFNPSTEIRYEILTPSTVRLDVFDILGRNVATLVNGRQSTGAYQVTFNAASFSSGVYFYRLQAGSFSETKRMLLVK
jgi:hypothetical protein